MTCFKAMRGETPKQTISWLSGVWGVTLFVVFLLGNLHLDCKVEDVCNGDDILLGQKIRIINAAKMTGPGPSSCGACKFLRRKCSDGCIFAPYFCYEQGVHHFAAVHKVFGASNVSKLLSHLPDHHRSEAAITISYEALARMRDPVYGCTAHIFALQQQIANLQEEKEFLESQVANFINGLSHQSSQTTNETNDWIPFSSQEDAIDSQHYYLHQQPHQPSHTSTTIGNVLLGSEMNAPHPPIHTPEYQHSYCNSTNEPNSLGDTLHGDGATDLTWWVG